MASEIVLTLKPIIIRKKRFCWSI